MAAWLKPLLLALLAALVLHLFGLLGIGSQMQASSTALAQKNDPLFTRTIEAASPQAEAPPPEPPKPIPPPPRAAPSAPIASQPVITETVAALPPPEPITPTPTVAAVTPTTPMETATAVASTPSQTLSTQPSGQTDSLLITGEWPADTRVIYQAGGYFQGRELDGSGQVQWTRTGELGQNYQVRVEMKVYGLANVRMTSQGKVSPEGLQPQVYEEFIDPVLGRSRMRVLRLEPKRLILEGERSIPRPTSDPLGIQDTVSQFIDLGHRFLMGRAKLEEGQNVRIWLGRPGGLDEWTFDIGPAQQIVLPKIGYVKVHHLKPRPLANARGPIYVEMWFAPSLQYLPAKIRVTLSEQVYVELSALQILQN
jgi:hypothetical protein